jgi:hypothetical protein
VCNSCYDNPKSRPSSYVSNSSSSSLSETNKQLSHENGSSGDSASTVSSGGELCLSPTDILDIEQPGIGIFCSYYL